jgi:hypothetical protein
MKKRVRIYKAGGQSNAVSQEEVYKYIADEMSAEDYDGDTDAISEKLAKLGVDTQTADAYIDEVGTYLEENNSDEVVNNNEITPEEQEAQQLALEEQYAAEEEARQAQLYAMYNTDTEEGVPDDNADEEMIMRQGGAKPSKRSFIKQYTKFAKMAQGGNTPSVGSDDIPGDKGRERQGLDFLNAVRNTANDAILKQEAEAQYQYAYGGIKMGEFEDGGIQQEQIDTESPYDHLAKDTAARRHIFSDNMYTQNDIAALEQYGGFTDSDSGLYKFIGGGDNESMDEQYQDSDLDYQRYAKRGRALHKYVDEGEVKPNLYNPTTGVLYTPEELAANKTLADKELADKTANTEDTEDWKKKYYDLNSQNTTAAQKQQQMLQQQMIEQYMNQMGNQMGNQGGIGKFRSPISRGMRYNQAVSDPYYTQSGEEYTGPDLAGRIPTTVKVDKYGIFGRPKQFTVNYGATPRISSFKAPIFTPGQNNTETSNTESDKQEANINNSRVNNRQPLANMMMKSGIPGIKQLGARMTRSGAIPEIPQETQPTTPAATATSNEPYYPPMSSKAQRRENRDDRQLNRFLGNQEFDVFNDPKEVTRLKNKLGTYNEFKEYGGPVDYSQYAYGGDVSIPELYKAQTGFETGADECPFGSTKDYKGDCVDFQGNITKKRNTNFKLSEPGELLKNPFSQPKKNALTGEMSGIDNITSNANLEYKDDADVSQDFKNKQSWDIDGKALADDSLIAANALAQQFEMANANKQQNQLQANLTSAETNFGISNEDNSGDYDPNSGLFRPDKMGAMQSKYGGGVYAMGGNTEDEDEDVEYMTEDQIKRFLAEGGELEYV